MSDDREYIAALAAFFGERWEQAVDLLARVLERHPGQPQVGARLAQARQQQQLADWHTRAERAAAEGRWGMPSRR